MSVTYKQLVFDFPAITRQLNAIKGFEKTKEAEVIELISESVNEQAQKYNKELLKLKIRLANKDKNGSVLKSEQGEYLFNEEGELALIEKADELVNTEVEGFEPIIIEPTVELNLPNSVHKVLKGIIY